MQRKSITKILIVITTALLIIVFSTNTFALTPKDITGAEIKLDKLKFIDNITDLVRLVGTFIAVGVLMVIGIRYIMGSVEERAAYKKSMMPYIIGCFILFGASYIAPTIKDIISNNIGNENATTESIGNSILGLIQVIGTLISVGAFMIIGIKYMIGSVEQKATYKKSMIPYIIGCIVLFGSVNITSMIYKAVPTAKGQAKSYFYSIIEEYGEESVEEVTKAIQEEMKKTEDGEYKDELSELLYEYSQEHMGE